MELKMREKILHIFNMALSINGVNGINVWAEFSGHTSGIEVYTYENGWSIGESPDYSKHAYLDHEDASMKLDNMIEYLEQLAKRNGINVAL